MAVLQVEKRLSIVGPELQRVSDAAPHVGRKVGRGRRIDFDTHIEDALDVVALHGAITDAIARKPKGHDFIIDRRTKKPAVSRHMSVTGG